MTPSLGPSAASAGVHDMALSASPMASELAQGSPAKSSVAMKRRARGTAGTFSGRRPPKSAAKLQAFEAAREEAAQKSRAKKAADMEKKSAKKAPGKAIQPEGAGKPPGHGPRLPMQVEACKKRPTARPLTPWRKFVQLHFS